MDNQEYSQNPPHQDSSVHVGSNIPKENQFWQTVKSSKLLKIGLPLLLIALLPVVVLLARQQQNIESKASASSTLYFTPTSSQGNPIRVAEGEEITLTIELDTGTNNVTAVQPTILYDKNIFEVASEDLTYNLSDFPDKLISAQFAPGEIKFALGVGAQSTTVLQGKKQVATISFRALKIPQNGNLSIIRFSPTTLVSARGDTLNVLSSTMPAYIDVNENPSVTPKITVEPTSPTGSQAASLTPAPACNASTADLNKDGRVDNADHTIAANCFKKNTSQNPSCEEADINKDTVVDIVDMNCILRGGL